MNLAGITEQVEQNLGSEEQKKVFMEIDRLADNKLYQQAELEVELQLIVVHKALLEEKQQKWLVPLERAERRPNFKQ